MTEKCYKINLDRLTSSDAFFDASAEELRVLLLVASHTGRAVSRESVSALAGVSEARAASALSLWESAGIIAECASLTDEFETSPLERGLTEEKSTAVARSIRNSHLAEAIAECTRLMKRATLSTPEIKKISALHTQLALSPEYILALSASLAESGKLTPHRLARTAEKLVEQNIDTLEELEIYLAENERTTSAEWEIKRTLGIYGRAISDTEHECFRRWSEDYGYSTEIIKLAYDVAVLGTGERSVPYIDSVLRDWHEGGCKTVAECKRRSEEHRAEGQKKHEASHGKSTQRKKTAEEPKYSAYNSDDALMQALLRSYGDDKKGEN